MDDAPLVRRPGPVRPAPHPARRHRRLRHDRHHLPRPRRRRACTSTSRATAGATPQRLPQFPRRRRRRRRSRRPTCSATARRASSGPRRCPATPARPMRYVDLMGGTKPHLLVAIVNNLGAETRSTTRPSTRSTCTTSAPARRGSRGCRSRCTSSSGSRRYDRDQPATASSRATRTTTATSTASSASSAASAWSSSGTPRSSPRSGAVPDGRTVDATSHVPPVLTKTWFHTGAYGRDHVSDSPAGLLPRARVLRAADRREARLLDRHRAPRRPRPGRGARGLPCAEGRRCCARRSTRSTAPTGQRIRTSSPSRTSRSGGCSRAAEPARRLPHPPARGAHLPLRARPGRPAGRARADARGRRLRQRR